MYNSVLADLLGTERGSRDLRQERDSWLAHYLNQCQWSDFHQARANQAVFWFLVLFRCVCVLLAYVILARANADAMAVEYDYLLFVLCRVNESQDDVCKAARLAGRFD